MADFIFPPYPPIQANPLVFMGNPDITYENIGILIPMFYQFGGRLNWGEVPVDTHAIDISNDQFNTIYRCTTELQYVFQEFQPSLPPVINIDNWAEVCRESLSPMFRNSYMHVHDLLEQINLAIGDIKGRPLFDLGYDPDMFLDRKLSVTGIRAVYDVNINLPNNKKSVIYEELTATDFQIDLWRLLEKINKDYYNIGYKLVGMQRNSTGEKITSGEITQGVYTALWEPIGDKGHGGVIRFNI